MTVQQLRAEVRALIAEYMQSEGCSCCRDSEKHEADKEALGKLLLVPRYSDGSGRDFSRYRREK